MKQEVEIVEILPDTRKGNGETYKYIAISTGILAIYHLFTQSFRLLTAGRLMDYVLLLLPLGFYLHYRARRHRVQNFMRWTCNTFSYRIGKTTGRFLFQKFEGCL